MEMRRTLDSGIYRMSVNFKVCPLAIQSSISLIPIAWTADPPRPLTGCCLMVLRDLKSAASGEICQVAPVSRIKGRSEWMIEASPAG